MLKLRLESPSDLWRISRLIQPGDRVGASTTRRDPEAPEDAPAAQRERRRVWIAVRAEQVEFHGFSGHVRVTGPILEAPFDVGRHHTLDLEDGADVTVVKESLTAAERALLEEGMQRTGEPTIVIAAVDWGESSVFRLRGRVLEPVADVNRTLAGKQYDSGRAELDRSAYVEELVQVIVRAAEGAGGLVIAGPGFLKESVARRLEEVAPALRAKARIIGIGAGGRAGVDELLRSGRASEVLSQSAAAEEIGLVEQLLRAISGGRRAAVGEREVGLASEAGAIETLLVSDVKLRSAGVVPAVDRARDQRARVFVVRDEGEAGKRLAALGGVAAILRYDWMPPAAEAATGSPGRPRAAPRSGA